MVLELKQNLNVNLKLQQSLVMTPQLQQAIRLLQLSRMELIDAIHQELEQNPVLEEENRPDDHSMEEERAINGEEPGMHAETPEPDKVQEVSSDGTANDIDWDQWLES
ncbi:MAG: RNA polymerase sigma-54 factor, partial [Myxococcales bacterium]|nr:RNA polymerase sigma-54 factor [Myxococcales bacterium]